MTIKDELLELLRTDPEAREAVRRQLFTDDLLLMPGRLEMLTARIEALAAAQQRTEERVGALAAAQHRTEEGVEALAAHVEALAAAQLRTEERLEALIGRVDVLVTVVEEIAREVAGLSDWRRGEQGRREGERYERNTVRRA